MGISRVDDNPPRYTIPITHHYSRMETKQVRLSPAAYIKARNQARKKNKTRNVTSISKEASALILRD